MEEYEGAEVFIDVLNTNGVQQIFFNPGADTAPIQATVTRMKAAGRQTPGLIMCLDESVAMTAAHGHYMISGRPQVVMVHAELGTLQVGGAMHNVQWGRVPVILWAGVMPGDRSDWKGERFEQGSIMRGCVKWDHRLVQGEDIYDVLQHAFDVAFSEPCGPVYLTYPSRNPQRQGSAEKYPCQTTPTGSLSKHDRCRRPGQGSGIASRRREAPHSGRCNWKISGVNNLAD